jgi:hypothetical protein
MNDSTRHVRAYNRSLSGSKGARVHLSMLAEEIARIGMLEVKILTTK